MEKPTTKLSAQDRVILFCVATGIDHGCPIQNGRRRLRRIKGLQWQTLVRGDIGRQRLFRPLANPAKSRRVLYFVR